MSILADWFRSVFPAKRTPQDRPPKCWGDSFSPSDKLDMRPSSESPIVNPTFLAKHGLTLDSKLSDAVCGESEFYKRKRAVAAKNFTKTPEQRKADHAKSVATKALKKARTAELRAALVKSVEEMK